jgi:hypothetical protein
MPFIGLFIIIIGMLLMYAGWKNQSPASILRSVFGA